jgi:VanZ family protein
MLTARLVNRLRRATAVAFAVYWIALFIGTHVPIPQGVGVGETDKLIHFFAYAGLAALAVLTVGLRAGAGLRARHIGLIVVGLAAFGGIDELTQPLVRREADWFDWYFDVAGVIVGTTLGATAAHWLAVGAKTANGECMGNAE